MGIKDDLTKRALGLSQKALEKLMADEKRAMQLAAAIGKVQKGKQTFDKAQDAALRQLNFAARGDFKALGKRMSSLKRRLRELDEKLEAIPARKP
ncbi:MAG: hypothetical protein IRZ16_04440 [Myxococcaceae bacterium]|nr:hypothetical protein [Myxococcaceae bacterium]